MFEDPDSLRQIAASAIKRAQSSVRWFAEVRDTLDGKPVQAIANPESEKFQVEVATGACDKLFAKLGVPATTADRQGQ